MDEDKIISVLLELTEAQQKLTSEQQRDIAGYLAGLKAAHDETRTATSKLSEVVRGVEPRLEKVVQQAVDHSVTRVIGSKLLWLIGAASAGAVVVALLFSGLLSYWDQTLKSDAEVRRENAESWLAKRKEWLDEIPALQAKVKDLEQRGARVTVRPCGTDNKFQCVRVYPRQGGFAKGGFGEGGDWFVLRGE